jgi:hypothetical protein
VTWPRPREPLTNDEAGRLLFGAALVRAREAEMVIEIARITHDDWVEHNTGPEWFVEVHRKGWCNIPFCDKCECCGSQHMVRNVVAADVLMCRVCTAGECKECRDDFEGF